MTTPLLDVRGVHAGYGAAEVLFGIDIAVAPGEIVGVLGRNGMGKTTLVRTIMGLLRPRSGTIALAGRDITGEAPNRIARAGVGLVPEGRQVFPNLSVDEHLEAFQRPSPDGASNWTPARVLALFPALAARRSHGGNQLSGGEQQMLAIGRALLTNPRLLILDEATEGLAPLIRQEIYRSIAELKADGLSILVIDKDVRALCRVAERHYVLEKGRVVWSGSSVELNANRDLQSRYLGV
jgi:branched-chain amino acid transport system ATP-binding protein